MTITEQKAFLRSYTGQAQHRTPREAVRPSRAATPAACMSG